MVISMKFRIREGDFVETTNHLIFDVKGFVHPPDRVIAYLRYVPDNRGARYRDGIRYRKIYALDKRHELLSRKWPRYLYNSTIFNREVQAVPLRDIRQHYIPTRKLLALQRSSCTLDTKERLAVEFAGTIANQAKVHLRNIGVSGSILVALHTDHSDIDLILYGKDTAYSTHNKLRQLLMDRSEGLCPLHRNDLHKLYSERSITPRVPFETFVRHERLKVLQGKFRGVHYFLRCIKEWNELEDISNKKYYPIRRLKIRGTVTDDSEFIFTPCRYKLTSVKFTGRSDHTPDEIVSYRGRFCEQVHRGNHVLAEGLLEKTVDQQGENYRLVIGEDSRDHLVAV